MKQAPFKLRVDPLGDGSFTRLRLCGSVVTPLPPTEIRRLTRMLFGWTGDPVEIVLPVDKVSVGWFEWWSYAIADIPARHLRIRFDLKRERDGGGDDDVR
jgi:hypothetical protein